MQQNYLDVVVRVLNQKLKIIMKKAIKHLGLVFTMCMAIVVSSCMVSFSGETVKEERDLKDFTSVSLAVPGNIYLSQGNSYSFSIEGDSGFLSEIITEVRGDKLSIRTEGWVNLGWKDKKVKIYITMPQVEGLSVSGSGDIIGQTAIETKQLDIRVSGSGDITIPRLGVETLNISISGSGDVYIAGKGKGKSASVKVTGSGDVNLEKIEFANADVSVSGSGDIYLFATETLNARVVGSGDIYYSGNPLVDGRVSGSGHIKNK